MTRSASSQNSSSQSSSRVLSQRRDSTQMIEYVPMDKRHDDFYESFIEQRIQKIKNPGQSGMEDFFPFPIEPLRAAPIALPQKRVSNTSSDSGVNSPHVLSPATPISPDKSQPRLIPSISRMNPPTGPLTNSTVH